MSVGKDLLKGLRAAGDTGCWPPLGTRQQAQQDQILGLDCANESVQMNTALKGLQELLLMVEVVGLQEAWKGKIFGSCTPFCSFQVTSKE